MTGSSAGGGGTAAPALTKPPPPPPPPPLLPARLPARLLLSAPLLVAAVEWRLLVGAAAACHSRCMAAWDAALLGQK
jgi:hypothetical protein